MKIRVSCFGKNAISGLVAMVMFFTILLSGFPSGWTLADAITMEGFASGSGTEEDPWTIETAEQLNLVRNYLGSSNNDKYFKLADDVDLTEYLSQSTTGWWPIGSAASSFQGNFDGDGHKITGLWMDALIDECGLFGCIQGYAVIQNLSVEISDAGIIGGSRTGGLVGYNNSISGLTQIINCHIMGDVSGTGYVGGIVGYQYGGHVFDSSATGNVMVPSSSGLSYGGGLVGYLKGGSIMNSQASGGNVLAVSVGDNGFAYAGGLVGLQENGTVDNSCATINVSAELTGDNGSANAGGLVGYQYSISSSSSSVGNSYATGDVKAVANGYLSDARAGGLVGYQYSNYQVASGVIHSSYATGNVSAISESHHARAGGVIGDQKAGHVLNCYATGSVAATSTTSSAIAGGLAGYLGGSLVNSYAAGNTSATGGGISELFFDSYTGGLVGYFVSGGILVNSFYDALKSQQTQGAGNNADAAINSSKTTTEMMTLSTYPDDWDFEVWGMYTADDGETGYGYPYLIPIKNNILITPAGGSTTYSGETQAVAWTAEGYYDEDNYPLEGVLGYQQNDAEAVLQNAGTYDIVQGTLSSPHYQTSFKSGVTYTIEKADQIPLVIEGAPAMVDYDDSDFTLSVSGGSINGTVTWTSNNTSVLSVNSTTGEVEIVGVGSAGITATMAGNDNYNEISAQVEIVVNKAGTTLVIEGVPAAVTYGDTNFTLAASGSLSSGAVVWESSNTSVLIVNSVTGEVEIVSPGEAVITATKAGDGNYVQAIATKTITVSAKSVTIIGATANDKVYDSTTAATLVSTGTISGKRDGDDVSVNVVSVIAAFSDKNAGANKTVTLSGFALTGADADKYTLSAQPASVTANISPLPTTISGVTAENKVYDGMTAAVISGTHLVDGALVRDDIRVSAGVANFSDRNVGQNKTVSFSGFVLTGADAGNYALTAQPANVTANITPKLLTVNLSVADKKYDGSDAAAYASAPSLEGVVSGDIVTLINGTPKFSSTIIEDNIPIVFEPEFSITGSNSANYTLVQPTGVTASILSHFTPVKDTHYTISAPVGTSGWYRDEFVITAAEGYLLSVTDNNEGSWVGTLTYSNDTVGTDVTFYMKRTGETIGDITQGEISVAKTENYKKDSIAPTGMVSIGSNQWNSFLNTITFGLFFKETQTVTINPSDSGSGLLSTQYYLSETGLSQSDITALSSNVWTSGSTFDVSPSKKFIVYAKITDAAGNVTYLSSDGVVLYAESEQGTESIEYARTSMENKTATVLLNGNTISEITCDSTLLTKDTDYMVGGNTITFMGTYLDTLALGNHTFEISYNPMGENYPTGIATTTVLLTVEKGIDPAYQIPANLNAIYGQTLEDIELPRGWVWDVDASTSVGGVGIKTFKAIFTPENTGDYQVMSGVELAVTVGYNQAMEDVIKAIEDIPAKINTQADIDKVNAAQEAFGLLTIEEQDMIPLGTIEKLNNAIGEVKKLQEQANSGGSNADNSNGSTNPQTGDYLPWAIPVAITAFLLAAFISFAAFKKRTENM